MNRLIKASSKVEVDPEAMEKLMVERGDFLHALENDIKPVSQTMKLQTHFGGINAELELSNLYNNICILLLQ